MATLSRDQIASYAKTAGFSGQDVNIAVAVALAESGGNPRAHNPVPPDDSYGLWQINMLGSMGPERRKRFGLTSNEDLYKPEGNAKAAFGIWQGSGWKAWTTYTRGTYKKFMGVDSAGSDGGTTTPSTVDADSGLGIGDGITGAIDSFGNNVFKGIANVGGILLAIALLVIGVLILAREQVASLAPVGKLKSIAKGVK